MNSNFYVAPNSKVADKNIIAMFGDELDNGTYYIKGRCREHTKDGTGEWIADNNADNIYVKAVIENDTVLILTPVPSPTDLQGHDIVFEGNNSVGSEQRVRVSITNRGQQEFYGNMFLLADGVWKSGNCVQVPGESTVDLYFKYTPSQAGKVTMSLSTSKESTNNFYTKDIVVDEEKATTLSVSTSVTNPIVNGQIYGNIARVSVKVRNTGTNTFNNYIKLTPWHLIGNMYWFSGGDRKYIKLDPGQDTTVAYTVNDLEYNESYCFHAEANGVKDANNNSEIFRFMRGIDYWTSDGEKQSVAPTSGPTFGADVVAVDIPGQTSVPTIHIADKYNPNIIVYYESNAKIGQRVLSVLKKKVKNIVIGDSTESVTLSDEASIYVPCKFYAEKASFTHAASASAANCSTLILPFEPQSVADGGGKSIDWFHSNTETGKNFVIEEFSEEEGSNVYFSLVNSLKAYRPYIVSYAGQLNGNVYDVKGKSLIYEASDLVIPASGYVSTYGNDYKFAGTLEEDTLTEAYVLNANGKEFDIAKNVAVQPFSAYFLANNATAAKAETLRIFRQGVSTDINIIDETSNLSITFPTKVYTLSGKLIEVANNRSDLDRLPKGIYIVDKNKLIK